MMIVIDVEVVLEFCRSGLRCYQEDSSGQLTQGGQFFFVHSVLALCSLDDGTNLLKHI